MSAHPSSRIGAGGALALGVLVGLALAPGSARAQGADAPFEALVEALRSDDQDARGQAALQLGSLGPEALPAVPAMVGAIETSDATVRNALAQALARVGADALPALVGALGSADAPTREWTAVAIGMMGTDDPDAVAAHARNLDDPATGARTGATFALSQLGSAAAPAVAALVRRIDEDPTADVRRFAVIALHRQDHDERAILAIGRALADEDVQIRGTAAVALGRVGDSARPAIPALLDALADDSEQVRGMVTDALRGLGPPAQAALGEALRGGDDARRGSVLDAIGAMGVGALLAHQEALDAVLADEAAGAAVRVKALDLLRQLSGALEPHVGRLGDLAGGPPEAPLTEATGHALVDLGWEGVEPLIRIIVGASDPATRRLAAERLGEVEDYELNPGGFGTPELLDRVTANAGVLIEALVATDDDELAERIGAPIAMMGESGIRGLARLLEAESRRTRTRALDALSSAEAGATAAAPAIVALLDDADRELAVAAGAALVAIGSAARPALETALATLAGDDARRERIVRLIRLVDPSWEPPALGEVLVAPPSYAGGVDRSTILRAERLRAGLRLVFRTAGFAVARDGLLPRPTLAPDWIPTARVTSLAPDAATIVEIHAEALEPGAEPRLTLIVHAPATPSPTRIAVPAERDDLLALVEEVVAGVATRAGHPRPAPLAVQDELAPTALSTADRLDLGFVGRVTALDEALEAFEGGDRSAARVATLALLCFQMGAHGTRISEVVGERWLGRALVYAELASRGPGAAAAGLADEVGILCRRFGPRLDLEPVETPLTAEMSIWKRVHEVSFAANPTYPAPGSLFELLVQVDYQLDSQGYLRQTHSFVVNHALRLDAALVWCRRERSSDEFFPPLEAAQIVYGAADERAILRELLVDLAGPLGIDDDDATIAQDLATRARRTHWDLVDNHGYARREDAVGDQTAAALLGLADLIEAAGRNAAGERGFRSSLDLDLGDLMWDLVARCQEIVWVRHARLMNVAGKEERVLLDSLRARYGEHRWLVASRRSGLPRERRKVARYHQEMKEIVNAAIEELVAGRPDAAVALVDPLVDRLDSDHYYIYSGFSGGTRWRWGSPLLEFWIRAGRVDEGLRRIGAVTRGFARGRFRYSTLYFRRDQLDDLPDDFGPVTNSSVDWDTRLEAAFRRGHHDAMVILAKQYPYAGPKKPATFAVLGRLLQGERDDEDLWARFEQLLKLQLEDGATEICYTHHWVAILDDRFGGDAHWEEIKDRLRLDEEARVTEAIGELWRGTSPERIEEILIDLRAVSDPRAGGSRDELFDDDAYEIAVTLEHQAFAHHVIAETDGLANLDGRDDLVAAAAALIGKSARLTGIFRGYTWIDRHPEYELGFAFLMTRYGADPARVADFVARIPDLRRILSSGAGIDADLAIVATSRAALATHLTAYARWIRAPNLDRHLKKSVDAEACFLAAFEAGDDEVAMLLAVQRATSKDGDLGWIRRYLPTSDAAEAWVEANAKDRAERRRWRRELAAPLRIDSDMPKRPKPLPGKVLGVVELRNP